MARIGKVEWLHRHMGVLEAMAQEPTAYWARMQVLQHLIRLE